MTDDLYVIHNDFVPGNTTALVTNEGVVLVDDKFEIDFPNIVAEVKKLTNQPIKYVINTHHHGDHSGSNAKMQAMNVQVVASEQARENMVDAKQPGQPTMTFDRHAHMYLGGKNVELYHFGRAHTNGDVVVLFPAQRTLAAGDMFTYGDDVPELIDYPGGGSAKEWTSTLDSALQLDFDNVVPGHGNVTSKAEMRKFREQHAASAQPYPRARRTEEDARGHREGHALGVPLGRPARDAQPRRRHRRDAIRSYFVTSVTSNSLNLTTRACARSNVVIDRARP